jgi:hypothetical protein
MEKYITLPQDTDTPSIAGAPPEQYLYQSPADPLSIGPQIKIPQIGFSSTFKQESIIP